MGNGRDRKKTGASEWVDRFLGVTGTESEGAVYSLLRMAPLPVHEPRKDY
jgi:hypothetical protein